LCVDFFSRSRSVETDHNYRLDNVTVRYCLNGQRSHTLISFESRFFLKFASHQGSISPNRDSALILRRFSELHQSQNSERHIFAINHLLIMWVRGNWALRSRSWELRAQESEVVCKFEKIRSVCYPWATDIEINHIHP
jgi:hypothetical protein